MRSVVWRTATEVDAILPVSGTDPYSMIFSGMCKPEIQLNDSLLDARPLGHGPLFPVRLSTPHSRLNQGVELLIHVVFRLMKQILKGQFCSDILLFVDICKR